LNTLPNIEHAAETHPRTEDKHPMTETFDKLKALLEQKGSLTDEDITQA